MLLLNEGRVSFPPARGTSHMIWVEAAARLAAVQGCVAGEQGESHTWAVTLRHTD
jgi:hypothetical protein